MKPWMITQNQNSSKMPHGIGDYETSESSLFRLFALVLIVLFALLLHDCSPNNPAPAFTKYDKINGVAQPCSGSLLPTLEQNVSKLTPTKFEK